MHASFSVGTILAQVISNIDSQHYIQTQPATKDDPVIWRLKLERGGVEIAKLQNYQSSSQVEQFPQAAGLGAAHRNLRLFLVVHAQLVGALKPRDDFADVIDVNQKRPVRPPKQIRIEIFGKFFQRPAIRVAFHARMAAGGHGYNAIFDGGIADILGVGQE